MQLKGDAADNPDQRITDDVKMFVEQTLGISVGLLSSIVTLASFVVILWGLSATAPLHIFGNAIRNPRLSGLGRADLCDVRNGADALDRLAAGRISIFQQQRFEADFRFNLVRVRENSEQIALLQGESAERGRLSQRFGRVVDNWYAIMSRTKRLTAFTASYSQAAVIFPFILVAPAYFADKIQLGGMMQTASAFGSVQKALSFFVSTYRTLAEWRAVVARLDGFETAIESAAAQTARSGSIDVVSSTGSDNIDLEQLLVSLPNGTPLVAADSFSISANERTLVTGPSGAGKSTLFRAIAGVWPFGSGSIAIPGKGHPDDAAAAAVFSGRLAEGRDRLSRRGRRVQFGSGQGCRDRGGPAPARRKARRGGALESHALARRAAAPWPCPRAAARAAISVPR